MGNRVDFANVILKNEKINKGEPRVYYRLKKYKRMGYYDIMKYTSENVTIVELMDYLSNVNHAISVVGYWIFDSNYKKVLVRNRESLDMIFARPIGEEQVAEFET